MEFEEQMKAAVEMESEVLSVLKKHANTFQDSGNLPGAVAYFTSLAARMTRILEELTDECGDSVEGAYDATLEIIDLKLGGVDDEDTVNMELG